MWWMAETMYGCCQVTSCNTSSFTVYSGRTGNEQACNMSDFVMVISLSLTLSISLHLSLHQSITHLSLPLCSSLSISPSLSLSCSLSPFPLSLYLSPFQMIPVWLSLSSKINVWISTSTVLKEYAIFNMTVSDTFNRGRDIGRTFQ